MLDTKVGIIVAVLVLFVIVLTFFVCCLRDSHKDLKKQVYNLAKELNKNGLLPYRLCTIYGIQYNNHAISIPDIDDSVSSLIEYLDLEEKKIPGTPAVTKLVKRKKKK